MCATLEWLCTQRDKRCGCCACLYTFIIGNGTETEKKGRKGKAEQSGFFAMLLKCFFFLLLPFSHLMWNFLVLWWPNCAYCVVDKRQPIATTTTPLSVLLSKGEGGGGGVERQCPGPPSCWSYFIISLRVYVCVRVCAEIFNDPEVSLNLFSFFLSLSLSAESVMYISIFN